VDGVDLAGFIKRIPVPDGWTAPTALSFENLRARVLSRDDLEDDVRGINASLELIRRTRGGDWPAEPLTDAFNFVDLVWHECEFREGYSFSYVVYDATGEYVGCCYLYPMGRRTTLTDELLAHDVDVSWWVTTDAYARDLYVTLYRALRHWLGSAFPFTNAYYSNREIPAD
jgi:hypothetical protein